VLTPVELGWRLGLVDEDDAMLSTRALHFIQLLHHNAALPQFTAALLRLHPRYVHAHGMEDSIEASQADLAHIGPVLATIRAIHQRRNEGAGSEHLLHAGAIDDEDRPLVRLSCSISERHCSAIKALPSNLMIYDCLGFEDSAGQIAVAVQERTVDGKDGEEGQSCADSGRSRQ